ncbi:MAG: hypothetical protein E3K36_09410 [Candidatus Brocadia sp.]|nr:hypothetical protein [Candidatus Brocadia sp.]
MTALKILGIDRITPKIIITGIGTLAWLGIATNGLYEFWKLLLTVFAERPLVLNWLNIFINLFPFFSFCAWISYIYLKFKPILNQRSMDETTSQVVNQHRGMVLSLSKPQKPPEEINKIILATKQPDISLLYKEQSIGQLFKGLYHHKDVLQYVWPLATKDSMPYRECIKEFLNKFMPNAKIYDRDGHKNICHLTESGELELIEQVKSLLSKIYSKENLNHISLKSTDIIVDISGGTKSITIGLIFGALDSSIDIQYVEQQSGKYNVIPLAIKPGIILDKMGEYLLELYSKIHIAKVG